MPPKLKKEGANKIQLTEPQLTLRPKLPTINKRYSKYPMGYEVQGHSTQ